MIAFLLGGQNARLEVTLVPLLAISVQVLKRCSRAVTPNPCGRVLVVSMSLMLAAGAIMWPMSLSVALADETSDGNQSVGRTSVERDTVASDEMSPGSSPVTTDETREDRRWQPGDPEAAIAGLIPAPAKIPGVGRWQAMMMPVGSHVETAVHRPDGKMIAFGDGLYVRIHDADALDMTGVLVGHAGSVQIDWMVTRRAVDRLRSR